MNTNFILVELILYLKKQEELLRLKYETLLESGADSTEMLQIKTKIETYREIMTYMRDVYPKHSDSE